MNRGEIRSLAVEIVDLIHGYTLEFSNTPEQHEREYDRVEEKLTVLATCDKRSPFDHRWVCQLPWGHDGHHSGKSPTTGRTLTWMVER